MQRRQGPRGPARAAAAGNSPHHDHPRRVALQGAYQALGVGTLAVVGLAVLAVTLLAATLGHGENLRLSFMIRAPGARQVAVNSLTARRVLFHPTGRCPRAGMPDDV